MMATNRATIARRSLKARELDRIAAAIAARRAERDSLIARYEHGDRNVTPDMINDLHDAIAELERDAWSLEHAPSRDMGDWNDKASRWHY